MPTVEPIAVIGAGCRLAGDANSPAAFWDLLLSGRDGIGRMPQDRWGVYRDLGPEHGAAVRRADIPGGFIEDIEGFDSAFFGLSPREAELMDPQQRLLLEVAWEALEHAGIPPQSLAGGDTGVFVGIGSDDYGRRLLEDLPGIEAWTGIGSAMCAAANRISYALDLHGPSMAIDTACSASLVATHLACQSLRAGESGVALVGGVNLIISPGLSLTLESAGATAPDGRCKPFDVSANGYGRGEGGAVLVLKRLSDAQRDGDRVLAVIRGSHISQDGRTNGIMAPSGAAQQQLLEETLRRSGIPAESVDYIEAHGTGTRLGDPLEAGALSAVYGKGRPADEPLLLGSVKPNIGHLEAGAGVASLLKAVLALSHGEIPPSLNYTEGNPAIDWDTNGLRVVTESTPWPDRGRPRRAGVSGFGYGGTISHVLLEQAPEPAAPAAAASPEGARLYPLSAKSRAALRQSAGELADWLAGAGRDTPLDSLGHTLALRRSHLEHRAAVVAHDREDLVAKLRIIAEGEQSREAVTGSAPADPGKGLVWVFSGHGSQWIGMGRELLYTEPVFAEAIDELEPVFLEEIGFSPRQVLTDGDFETVDRVQTMIFAVQIGLAAVWRSYGITPDAVIGHSVGEIAAAVTAGALSPADGARLICRRSKLLRRVAGRGAMAMASLSLEETTERLAGRTDVVAAISASPASTVVSGDIAAIEALVEEWQADGVQLRRVASDVAFHSPQMDPLLEELAAAAADLNPREPLVPMYSTALEDPRTTPSADGAYWAANLRNTVRLAAATRAAAEDGYRAFLEVSAHPVVAHSIGETLGEEGIEDAFVGSTLRRAQPERVSLLSAVAAAHTSGTGFDWGRLQPAGELVALPLIAWQRQPHWRATSFPGAGQGLQHDVDSHALLGAPVSVSGRSLKLWRSLLEDANRPYPGSHTINGTEIVPAAVLINTFLAATGGTGSSRTLGELALRLPLTVSERRELQVVHDDNGLSLSSRPAEGEGEWLTHTTATAGPAGPDREPAAPPALPEGLAAADPGDIQRHLASVGVPTMGFEWTVDELLRAEGVLHARVRAGQPEHAPATWAPLFDAALSIAPSAYPGPATLRMVAGLAGVRVDGAPPAAAEVRVTHDARTDTVDVLLAAADGTVLAALEGVRYGSIGQDTLAAAHPRELVHELVWRPLEPASASAAGRPVSDVVLIGAADGPVAGALRERLAAEGGDLRVLKAPEELAGLPGLGESTEVLVVPPVPVGDEVPDAAAAHAWLLLETAQRLAALETVRFPRLWCLTTGVRESREAAPLAHAPLWGLGRVIAGEHGELWGGVVDLPADDPAAAAGPLLDVLRAAPREDVVSIRDGVATTARLVRTEREAAYEPVACRADGTYLITGGLGVLGLEVAHWLAGRGARRLVLAGRRGLPPRAEWDTVTDPTTLGHIAGIRALEALGVTVRTVALDIADAEGAARLLTADALGLPPIRGIVHAAGVLDNRMVPDVDEASLRGVMRPKAEGAWVLHERFPVGSLDFFVLFSSCGQLLGLPGQASYGAANAFLDALALHRNASAEAAGLVGDTTSFAWTSWRGQGMAVNEVVDLELRERGVADISLPEAFGAWDHAARRGAGYFPVLRTVALEAGSERLPLLREIAAAETAAAGTDQGGDSFEGLAPEELRERLLDEVAAQIAGEMRLPVASLDIRRSLVEQGLDSVMTIVIRRRLEKRFGHKLPATLLWHQPTVAAISEHLAGLLAPESESESAA
ncbi:type I polyketide synthase [Streptomyces antarcticus]|uniref:type I polyketide synthase n=1 Tax=Streptomyces antarcticus TaxID=2996458 RepID=UPI0022702CE4|nr:MULTISPECIES: type I polyketide synthase [unclassified Streptomyces]MCY0941367.1 type I polyketide synthase [Streptomyces sp. H34-AA3]MCZ4086073.1 type I polyketide synthase [Streptomyces sp. H34-S5]